MIDRKLQNFKIYFQYYRKARNFKQKKPLKFPSFFKLIKHMHEKTLIFLLKFYFRINMDALEAMLNGGGQPPNNQAQQNEGGETQVKLVDDGFSRKIDVKEFGRDLKIQKKASGLQKMFKRITTDMRDRIQHMNLDEEDP